MKRCILVVLCLPCLGWGQQLRVDYNCDFETGDCGLKSEKNTGASFRHQDFAHGTRITKALVLEDLSPIDPWFPERGRSARVSTPIIFPTTFVGPMVASLDYFLIRGACVDYLQLGQELGNRTETLIRANTANTWTSLKTTLRDFGQPVKLVVEAILNPNCQEYRFCSCAGNAAIDNIRVTSTGTSNPNPAGYRKPYKKSGPQTTPAPCPTYPPCTTPRPSPPKTCPPLPPALPCPPGPTPPPCPPCPYIPPPGPCPPPPLCPPIKPCPGYPACPQPFPGPWNPKMIPYKHHSGGVPPLPVWDPIHNQPLQQGEEEQQVQRVEK